MRFKKTVRLIMLIVVVVCGGLLLAGMSDLEVVKAEDSFSAVENYNEIEKSLKGLNEYKNHVIKQNIQLVNDKIKGIKSTITFSKPLTYDELIEYINKYNLIVAQVQARGLKDNNTRLTVATKYCENFDKITKKQLDNYKNSIFVGYTDIYADLDFTQMEEIQKDQKTFLVDTSADAYFVNSNKTVDGIIRNKNKKGNKRAHSLTWLIEDLKQQN